VVEVDFNGVGEFLDRSVGLVQDQEGDVPATFPVDVGRQVVIVIGDGELRLEELFPGHGCVTGIFLLTAEDTPLVTVMVIETVVVLTAPDVEHATVGEVPGQLVLEGLSGGEIDGTATVK